jgi:hypothetical protein
LKLGKSKRLMIIHFVFLGPLRSWANQVDVDTYHHEMFFR